MALDLESYYIERRNAVDSHEYYNQVYGGDISHMFKHKDIGKQERVRQIIAEKNKGTNAGENSKVAKKVICLNTNEIFISTAEASLYYGLSRSTVSRACSPNGDTKTAGKHPDTGERLKWMYYDEYIAISKGEKFEYNPKSAPKRKKGKSVICINTGEVFESIAKANKATGTWTIQNSASCGVFCGKCKITGEPLLCYYYDYYIDKVNVKNYSNRKTK